LLIERFGASRSLTDELVTKNDFDELTGLGSEWPTAISSFKDIEICSGEKDLCCGKTDGRAAGFGPEGDESTWD
jgi:hypothetical protein